MDKVICCGFDVVGKSGDLVVIPTYSGDSDTRVESHKDGSKGEPSGKVATVRRKEKPLPGRLRYYQSQEETVSQSPMTVSLNTIPRYLCCFTRFLNLSYFEITQCDNNFKRSVINTLRLLSGKPIPTASTSNPPADLMEILTVESPIPTVSSPVPTVYFTDSQKPSSDARLISKRVANQEKTPSLDNILSLTNRFKDILRVTTNSDESNGVEADISNMETSIIASPTPTLRIHKDHPKRRASSIQNPEWVLKNKKDERGIVIRNKARLVAQGNIQEERIDYDEVFAHVARIKAIRLFLAYASFMGFTVYQMDVKSAFLYGTIDEEVYVMQPPGFQDPEFLAKVYKVEKAMYGLHQALRAWYGTLSKYLLKNGFQRGTSKYWGVLRILMISLRLIPLSEHNVDFHPVVDFIEASPLRIETTEEGTKILATVDGILRTVTESSLRRNLKLKDEDSISSLPDTKLFENLTLMGYNISPNQKFTFQKGQFSHQWKYLIHTIMQCLSPKSTRFNEFSSNIATALVCLMTNRTYNFSKMIFDGLVKNVNNKPGEGSGTPTEPHHTPSLEAQPPSHTTHSSSTLPPVTTASIPTVTLSETTPIRQYTRRARIAQSFALLTVVDEPESHLRDVSQGEACPTNSGFIAVQNRAAIAKSSTLPYDLAPRVTSPATDEGTHEVKINRLKERVKLLEDREGGATEGSRDDAPIKGRNLDEWDALAERASDDTEEMATVLMSMDASTVSASGATEVPTGSGSIPTAGPPAAEVPTGSDVVPTASPVFANTTVIDAQVARELEEQLEREDQRRSEHIARDEYHQFASELPIERRIELISDLVKSYLGWKVKDFRGMTYEEVEAKLNSVLKQMEDFIPMGSKEEAERIKRNGLNLEQESAKKQKTSKEVTEEAKSPDEVPKEKETLSNRPPTSDKEMKLWVELSRLYEPDDEDQLWNHTKNFMHAPVEWKLYDLCEVHHVTSKDKEIFMLVEKDYPLRKGLALVMICYKLQVENYSQMANDLILKIYKIANSPR
uniref:Putative ribonuclease H-like domain-containing protein n=1 Tax=Tanacetum cinerariifolium TaxID=118510 RepID=A0A699HFJ7_TANCI|nr:putative ribonuclease H-like domain-containing protein [Tanacetum cinerariifolium]